MPSGSDPLVANLRLRKVGTAGAPRPPIADCNQERAARPAAKRSARRPDAEAVGASFPGRDVPAASSRRRAYSTVTDFARLRGWSTSVPLSTAV